MEPKVTLAFFPLLFAKTALSYWWAWLSGSVLLFLVGLFERHFVKSLTIKQYGAFLSVGLFVSCFQAWRDEWTRAAALNGTVVQMRLEKEKWERDRRMLEQALVTKDRPISVESKGNQLRQRVLNLAFQVDKYLSVKNQTFGESFEMKFSAQFYRILEEVSDQGINTVDEIEFCRKVKDMSEAIGCSNRLRKVAGLLQ